MNMSITDDIEKLISANPKNKNLEVLKSDQLQRLEEVEKVLFGLGVSLEPKFEMPLNSRYGLYHKPSEILS